MRDASAPVRSGLRSCGLAVLRGYLSFALRTTRWTFVIDREAMPYLTREDGRTAIIALWHEVLPLTSVLWWWAEPQNPALRLRVLISRNADGRMIADLIAPWRISSIAGSSDTKGKNKGGAAALRQMRASLQRGDHMVITPDGPRGPRRRAQQGVLALARLSDKPVIPIGAACFSLRVRSWDRMVVPLPFGRGVLACGAPLVFGPAGQEGRSTAGQLHELETALERVTALCARPDMPPLQGFERETCFVKPARVGPSGLWHGVATLLTPVLPFFLRWRQTRGKELPHRVREKMGFASRLRPGGDIAWFHAASVGELVTVLPLVQACLDRSPALGVLVTTGTVTAAAMLEQRISHPRVIHQFMPLDVPRWGRRFLDHWKPQVAVFAESELWPNMLGLCHARLLPVVLVNGRVSDSTFRQWRRMPRVARRMLERFAWVCARSMEDAERLRVLGARTQLPSGDLKACAQPLPVDEEELRQVRARIGARPVFLAASTHAGEEEQIIRAAELARRDSPDLLTIIVPRHPERGQTVSAMAAHAPRRALGQMPGDKDAVWVCDTLGELGLFFRLASCVFIGNSLPGCKGGGHNPYEPARLHCALATGPLTGNFDQAFARLASCVTVVADAPTLADWLRSMMQYPGECARQADMAYAVATADQALPDRLAAQILALW
ncbi:MAG: glycosyltransferase N-terminal domain-containing protein [Acetobacter sp.]|uniref:glycosyltransferase N-terminal domain-containing protein n=1 Tax=Acetobacter sp. TaxID=440 RepID=UPI0039E86292